MLWLAEMAVGKVMITMATSVRERHVETANPLNASAKTKAMGMAHKTLVIMSDPMIFTMQPE